MFLDLVTVLDHLVLTVITWDFPVWMSLTQRNSLGLVVSMDSIKTGAGYVL